ncbi:MAG: adenosylmethionine decarboxylase [Aestuariivirgaceae bacterium]
MTDQTLYQLGMDLVEPGTAQTESFTAITDGQMSAYEPGEARDHFTVKNGVECAGTHLIIDLIGANRLDDIRFIEETLRRCVTVAGATLLHLHLHHFTPNAGVSGVAVLAESHISIHTWPERQYAALDIFMCGDAQPKLCVEVLREAFAAADVVVGEHLRGQGV